MRKFWSLTILGLFVSAGLFTSVQAVPGGVGGNPKNITDPNNPGWFVYNLGLGAKHSDVIVVKNGSTKEWLVDVYPADYQESAGGGFGLKQKVEEMTEMGSWIQLETNEILLKPGEVREIPFVITIPENANVGETAGAIMVERRDPHTKDLVKDMEGKNGVRLSIRVGTRVYNVVPGEINEQLEILKTKYSQKRNNEGDRYLSLEVPVENRGNVSTKVEFEVLTKNVWTEEILVDNRAKPANFFVNPRSTFDYHLKLDDLPMMATIETHLIARMVTRDKEKIVLFEKTLQKTLIPYTELALLALVVIAGIVLGVYKYKKRR